MRRPSAIIHMSRAGTWMGTILGAAYGFIFGIVAVLTSGFGNVEIQGFLGVMMLGGTIGGIFGLPMGLLIGVVLALAARRYDMPISPADLRHLKTIGQNACFVAGVGAFGFIFFSSGGAMTLDIGIIIIIIVPLIVAFFASIWAVNRYLRKLDTFVGGKSKAKRAGA